MDFSPRISDTFDLTFRNTFTPKDKKMIKNSQKIGKSTARETSRRGNLGVFLPFFGQKAWGEVLSDLTH